MRDSRPDRLLSGRIGMTPVEMMTVMVGTVRGDSRTGGAEIGIAMVAEFYAHPSPPIPGSAKELVRLYN